MPRTLRLQRDEPKDISRRHVRGVDKMRESRLRRRAGLAVTRLEGTVTEQSADIGRTHQAMVRRRQGVGPLADTLVEVYAHELNGRDTTPWLEAVIETQIEARTARGLKPLGALSEEEAAINGEENVEQIRYHRTGCARGWRSAYLRKVSFALSSLLPAMMRER